MKIITVFIALALVSPIRAATTIIKENGKPLQAVFDDGRIAELAVDREPVLVIEFPFGLDENTCTPISQIDCTFKSSIRVDRFVVRWAAHPDAKKIGKPVIRRFPQGGFQSFFDFMFHTSGERLVGFPSVMSMPADELSCHSYDWLPGATAQVPETLVVPRWDCEAMFPNPETGLNENRVVASVSNLKWAKNASGSLSAEQGKMLGPQITLFQGDIIALIHKTQDGYCQQSLKPNFGKVIDAVTKYIGDIKDDWMPYLYGSDEFSISNNNAKLFFSNPDEGVLE